nr:hypothetical protein BdHM001_36460 [Bdellovibrio sp. HM001]
MKNSEESMRLARYLKDKRVEKGISQRNLAAKLNYATPQFISNWERGVSKPPVETLKRLSSLIGANLKEMEDIYLEQTLHEVAEDFRRKARYGRAS